MEIATLTVVWMMNYMNGDNQSEFEAISEFAMKPDSTRLAVYATKFVPAEMGYLFVVNTDQGMVDSKKIRFEHNKNDPTAVWLLGGMLWNTKDDLHMLWWNPGVGAASGAEENNSGT